MSGGPIVGFYREGGETKYLLHAIQSTWNERGTVYGCYVRETMQVVMAAAAAEQAAEAASAEKAAAGQKEDH